MKSEEESIIRERLPKHIAIIMDGNGRWAKERGKLRIEGHRQGAESVRAALESCCDLGIEYLTLYAFSVENWKRPEDEVQDLMKLLLSFLKKHTKDLLKNKTRLHTIGDITRLPEEVQKQIQDSKDATADFKGRNLVLALNYGSRQEVCDAVKKYCAAVESGKESSSDLTWEKLDSYLHTNEIPDPDLLIRTSGEMRISNFLLLQSAYAEVYFTDTYWPDFRREHLVKALLSYQQRERRFGLTTEQLQSLAQT